MGLVCAKRSGFDSGRRVDRKKKKKKRHNKQAQIKANMVYDAFQKMILAHILHSWHIPRPGDPANRRCPQSAQTNGGHSSPGPVACLQRVSTCLGSLVGSGWGSSGTAVTGDRAFGAWSGRSADAAADTAQKPEVASR